MKARIRKTGEIVEIISHSGFVDRNKLLDEVSYIDSNGVEHAKESLNYYWDFEPIEDKNIDEAHWQDVRERAAIAAMQGMLSNPQLGDTSYLDYRLTIAKASVGYADELVKQLKEHSNETH